jgi:hypothetical protein
MFSPALLISMGSKMTVEDVLVLLIIHSISNSNPTAGLGIVDSLYYSIYVEDLCETLRPRGFGIWIRNKPFSIQGLDG